MVYANLEVNAVGENLETLRAAFSQPGLWLEDFRRRTYMDAFRDYQERFAPACAEAVAETAGDEDAQKSLAEELLAALDQERRRRPFWERGALAVDQRQVAAIYFSPMLLALDTEESKAFCLLFREAWTARWPKETYGLTTAEHIQKGFKTTFMGIPLERKNEEKDWM